MSKLIPRRPVPALSVSTLDGTTWALAEQKPKTFTMIAFYRGLHCPICKPYLRDLDRKLAEFEARGVMAIAVSSDSKERAQRARDEWELERLPIGFGLSIDKGREWGLYVSSSRGKTSAGIEEPALFTEPGLFLIRPDGTLYAGTVQTMPFARPSFSELSGALDFIIKTDYPARGEA